MVALAVLTGDLVNSSLLTPARFQQVMAELTIHLQASCVDPRDSWEVFRGDSFQLTLNQPARMPLVALQLKWALIALSDKNHKVDARMAISFARVQLNELDSTIFNTEAHNLSGKGLDSLKNERIKWFCGDEYFHIKTDLLTRFADNRLQILTPTQAQALLLYSSLAEPTHQALASAMGSSRVNVTRLLNAADYNLLLDYGNLVAGWIEEYFHVRSDETPDNNVR
ncbi:hypothetical protein [Shewanella sp. GXUN23E]|uniref:hypothetical protein n=1 Tax=Shewanella sp. GXUN23E TaxID=3422498 RepID=UPI003D7E8571